MVDKRINEIVLVGSHLEPTTDHTESTDSKKPQHERHEKDRATTDHTESTDNKTP